MPQTTGAFSPANFQIEVSLNGSSWTDISGSANSVSRDGGDQMTGTQFTANGDVPVVVNSNKRDAVTLTISIIYTEVPGEAFQTVYDRYIGADKTIYLRYAPKGSTVSNKRYVCANSAGTAIPVPIISCLPPETDSASGDPALTEFSVITPNLFQEAIT